MGYADLKEFTNENLPLPLSGEVVRGAALTTSNCHSTNLTVELPGLSVSSRSLEEEWNEQQRDAPKLIFYHVLRAIDNQNILCYYLDG